MRGLLVTGTDTGVGKTVLAAAIVASLRERGHHVQALKPVLTGLQEPPDPVWPHDHVLLGRVSGADPDDIVLAAYGPPFSPHLAADLAGRPIEVAALAEAVRRRAAREDHLLVVEGVGGLLVPLSPEGTVRELARALALPLVVAARPGLGTINHTLLTLEAARRADLAVAAVVLTPWPERPGKVERSNRETIARRGHVEVEVLPRLERPEPAALARAAAGLPLERWIEGPYSS